MRILHTIDVVVLILALIGAIYLICFVYTVTATKLTTLSERVEVLECQVGRILHPGLVNKECE